MTETIPKESKINLHPKYIPFFNSDSRYFICRGGRSSGKSHAINAWVVLLTYEKGHTVLHTRFSASSAKDSIVADVKQRIEEMGLESDFDITRSEIINRNTGSKIIFKGLKSQSSSETARLKSISGITTWIIEEAEDLRDEDLFDKIDLGIRGTKDQKRLRVVMILNPTDTEHFIYKRWFGDTRLQDDFVGEKDDACYILSHWTDIREHLSTSEVNAIMRMKRNQPQRYKFVIDGAWMYQRDGVIYTEDMWRIGSYKETDNCAIGIDFGFTHPTAIVKVSVDHELKVAYLKELLYEPGLVPADMHKFILKNKLLGYDWVGDGARPEIIEELSRKMVLIKGADKGPGSVLDGINLMQDFHLIIDPDSKNLIKELKMYIWDQRDTQMKEVPVKEWDDALDAARYAIMSLRKQRIFRVL